MQNHNVGFLSIGAALLVFAVLGVVIVRPALALEEASSSLPTVDSSTTVSVPNDATTIGSTSTIDETVVSTSSDMNTSTSPESAPGAPEAVAASKAQTPPPNLTEVHITGTNRNNA
jgi:hypothetical protein